MLLPKRTKFRKQHRGRRRGIAKGQQGVSFGDYGLKALEPAWITNRQIEAARVGLVQPWRATIDEGWTRWLLEDFEFPYSTIMDDEILRGRLSERWDVIILPADSKQLMTEGRSEGGGIPIPPDYRSGFGQEGTEALRAFVEEGGTLVTFAQAGELVLDDFGVPVRDAGRCTPPRRGSRWN